MSLKELTKEALSLSVAERIHLAQSLWASVEDSSIPAVYDEEDLHRELKDRLTDQPDAMWKTHDQIMTEAKRKFGCEK